MDSDLIAFLISIVIGCIILAIALSYIDNNETSITKTAMEQGYCSSINSLDTSKIIWRKCETATTDVYQ